MSLTREEKPRKRTKILEPCAKPPKLRLEPIPATLIRRAKRKPKFLSELQHQLRLIAWINETAAIQTDVKLAEALTWIHSIANGHARMNPVARMNAMREGMRAGVLDLFCPHPAFGKGGMYIEMKRRDGQLSEDQRRFMSYLDTAGYEHYCAHDWVSAAKAVISWYRLESFAPLPFEDEDSAAIRQRLEAMEEVKEIKARNKEAEKVYKRELKAWRKIQKGDR